MNKEILRKFTIIFGLTLFMLLSLTATKTYAANIGTVLKNPENGWTRYEAKLPMPSTSMIITKVHSAAVKITSYMIVY